MKTSGTFDGSLRLQESRAACSSPVREKAMARVVVNVVFRSLGGAVEAVTNFKPCFSPVSPVGEQAEEDSA